MSLDAGEHVVTPAVWPSPITAQRAAAGRARLLDVQLNDGDAYWVEGRPLEHGRCVIVREHDGVVADLIDAPYSARTWVHEYGGAAMRAHGATVYFSNAGDGRIHTLIPGGTPQPLTPVDAGLRYADFEIDATRNRLICVVEDHRGGSVVNDIRAVPLGGGAPVALVSGNDFYSNPRVSPDGGSLLWLTWNQPNMPWDGCELWVAGLDSSGMPRDARLVAGGPNESIFQPSWSPESVVHCTSDRTGWWNLYRWDGAKLDALAPMQAECGAPQWMFGLSTYAFCGDGRVVLWACRDGGWEFFVLGASGELTRVEVPDTAFALHVSARGDDVLFHAGGPDTPYGVVRCNLATGARRILGSETAGMAIDESILSTPRHMTFPGYGGATAHAWYYAPRNDGVDPEPGRRPPLLLRAHGGPTSAAGFALDPSVQFWTSRGFAYLDVDYGGSSGYGRTYRDRLNQQWGVVDVGDCLAGARHLVDAGDVDPGRLFMHGGSAGGYAVLCAMTFHHLFQAGASLFGIADLEELFSMEGHKFEARYDAPLPKGSGMYERSPVHFIDRVRGAVLLLQGLDDPVVPANQAEMMFAALKSAGVPCAYIGFPGEQHGFRDAANIARTLEAELYFFATVTGMTLAERIEPVDILNL
ncbi:MAG TPA: prolyl oligopeptidase family serine peptidase [Candidatus Saccharimonadales bacterium]|nr:prolyl oligopeptidase family serine peptidase [Candidatus Saccharimonadales bacterium]